MLEVSSKGLGRKKFQMFIEVMSKVNDVVGTLITWSAIGAVLFASVVGVVMFVGGTLGFIKPKK